MTTSPWLDRTISTEPQHVPILQENPRLGFFWITVGDGLGPTAHGHRGMHSGPGGRHHHPRARQVAGDNRQRRPGGVGSTVRHLGGVIRVGPLRIPMGPAGLLCAPPKDGGLDMRRHQQLMQKNLVILCRRQDTVRRGHDADGTCMRCGAGRCVGDAAGTSTVPAVDVPRPWHIFVTTCL